MMDGNVYGWNRRNFLTDVGVIHFRGVAYFDIHSSVGQNVGIRSSRNLSAS